MPRPRSSTDFDKAETAFVRFLRSRGIKYTGPRREILRAALTHRDHFEAEQLLAQLRQGGSRVAKATIYRTLPLLVDCGILKQVRFSDNQAHYEPSFGQPPHDHMVCRGCGRIIEFASRRVERLRGRIARENDFVAQNHRFQISGLCSLCAGTGTEQDRQ